MMRARDVMTPHVISIGPETTIQAAANTMASNRISALPVVDISCKLLGIISEGDLMHRTELGTERVRSWWLKMISPDAIAADFAACWAKKVKDVMTRDVVTVSPNATLREIANLLEQHGIKRVPVVENGRVVGIVSRANLVQALASIADRDLDVDRSDDGIRQQILKSFKGTPWENRPFNVIVENGRAELWGYVFSDQERNAIRVAAEATPGVTAVNDNLRLLRNVSGI